MWLSKVLSGKQELRLKPEVEKAIKEGNLLNTDKQPYMNQMKSAPTQLPITKDFSSYVKPTGEPYIRDTATHKINLDSITPSMYMKYYGPKIVPQVDLGSFSLEGVNNYEIPPRFNLTTDPLNKGGSLNGGTKNVGLGGGASISFSAADALEQLFSPAARAKARNRKHANAWKTYNDP
nr:hypothetical protein FACS189411_08940 [Bacteroidia bacterium]